MKAYIPEEVKIIQDKLKNYQISEEKKKALSSYATYQLCEHELITLEELTKLDVKVIQVLCSMATLDCCVEYNIDPRYLSTLSYEKLSALLSPNARIAYEQGVINMEEDLMDCEPQSINILVSDIARKAYSMKLINVKDLKSLAPDEQIVQLTNICIKIYDHKLINIDQLREININKLGTVISDYSCFGYENTKTTPLPAILQMMSHHDIEDLQILGESQPNQS